MELSETGEPVEGAKREDFVFTLGSGYNLYQFDEDIQGMRKNETREFEKTYPQDFAHEALAGRTVKLRAVLTALKTKSLPELDDEFAQDVDEKYQTLEDLKTDIRRRFTRDKDKRLRDAAVNRLLEKIIENSPMAIPESMILVELEARWRKMAAQFQTTPEELVNIIGGSGRTKEEILAEWRSNTIKMLHGRFIVETLLEEQNFTLTDEEKEQEFADLAENSKMTLEEVKQYYEQENMQSYLEQGLKERKLFDLLLAENTVAKGGKKTFYEFYTN
jgi:trigger factor